MGDSIGVIGGGILGIALARALTQREMGSVTVLEKERRLAAHQTGHNSGVVHAGVYYAPGSLKASLCAQGRVSTRDYCLERQLPYRELGKLIVATAEDELPGLAKIEARAVSNNVPGLRRLGPDEIREIEPHVSALAALQSPHTAVTDFTAITEAMANDVRLAGGSVLLDQEVTAIAVDRGRIRLVTSSDEHSFDRVIICAGLQSDVLAKLAGAPASPRILPFRGEYWALSRASQHLVNGMIYPVPDPSFPFLGVHFTRGVYDGVHVGPNAVPALAREGYTWGTVSIKDTWGSLRWPGARELAKLHWRMGAKEIAASLFKTLYFKQAQRYVPELQRKDLDVRVASGVRAQAWAQGGALLDDFAVDQVGAITLLRNAPSPAATSAMAIADHVVENYLTS